MLNNYRIFPKFKLQMLNVPLNMGSGFVNVGYDSGHASCFLFNFH